MKIDLSKQIALITGASRGIGKAIASSLAKSGATIIGTARTPAGTKKILDDFKTKKIDVYAKVLDVSQLLSIESLFEQLNEENLTPTILINNAGIIKDNLILRMKDDEWLDVINTDLNAIFRMSKMCLKSMIKMHYGRIISISSVVAFSGNPGQVNYSSAKAGLIGFTKSLAREVGSRGITVNTVAPGFIETDMTDALSDEQKKALTKQIALGRLGMAREVADTVTFLASEAAGYITGETINVNGGVYMA